MAEAPTFPQESVAIQYIANQAAKIEDASSCTTAYYRVLGKVLDRLEKTDTEINQLKQVAKELKELSDGKLISDTVDLRLRSIETGVHEKLSTHMANSIDDVKDTLKLMIVSVNKDLEKSEEISRDTQTKMQESINRLDSHIKEMNERVFPPLWKIWAAIIIAAIVGIGIGRFI